MTSNDKRRWSSGKSALIALVLLGILYISQRVSRDASGPRILISNSDGPHSKLLSRDSQPPPSLDNREVIAAIDDTELCEASGRLKDDCIIAATSPLPPTDANRCLLILWRSAEASGCSNGIVAPPHLNRSEAAAAAVPPVSKTLCPCARKKIVTVHAVTILASMLKFDSKHFAIDELMAVTQSPSTSRDDSVVASFLPTSSRTSSHSSNSTTTMDVSRPFYLIDVSTSQFVFRRCRMGEAAVVKMTAATLKRQLSRLRQQLPLNSSTNANSISRSSASTSHHTGAMQPNKTQAHENVAVRSCPWCCTALRKHPLSTHRELDQPPPSMYYSVDLFTASGHAMEALVSGIGQYVTQGFHAQRVPWLVPCSDDWGYGAASSHAPWLWTEFFAELNEALQFPFYPVDFKHFDIDSPHFSPLVFGTVHFAVPAVGFSSLCYKKVSQSFVWPHAVRLAAKRDWDAVAEKKFQEALRYTTTPSSNLPSPNASAASSSTALWTTNHRIAFMKVLHKKSSNVSSNAIGAFKTPGRSYDYSDRFERALVERGILSMNPTMPLFERMWHVNNAELIVTTWGSTLTVLIHILFERQQRADGANFTSQANESRVSRADSDDASHVVPTRPLRILILVHPRYIAETTLLFGKTLGLLSDPQRMPTSLSSPLYSHVVRHRMMRMRGASTDYYGGRDFCVKFVLVHKLDFVGSQELDFHC